MGRRVLRLAITSSCYKKKEAWKRGLVSLVLTTPPRHIFLFFHFHFSILTHFDVLYIYYVFEQKERGREQQHTSCFILTERDTHGERERHLRPTGFAALPVA